MKPCFNCGAPAHHDHHVVPRSIGGVATVPLCGDCHGKAHGHHGLRSTTELTRAALAVKRSRGERTGGIPYGYSADAAGRRVPDAAEQRVVARVRELRAEGATFRAIVEQLRAEGITSRKGGALTVAAVHAMVKRHGPQSSESMTTASMMLLGTRAPLREATLYLAAPGGTLCARHVEENRANAARRRAA